MFNLRILFEYFVIKVQKLGVDKIVHANICMLLMGILLPLMPLIFVNLVVIGLSVGKEIYDSKQIYNKFDWLDLLADFIGIAFVNYLVLLH